MAPEQRFVFDEVADLYAQVRPSYPAALVEDLVLEAGLRPGSRVLEIGCGPGNASALLAGRRYRMVCLEPGARLADIARQRLQSDPDVTIVTRRGRRRAVQHHRVRDPRAAPCVEEPARTPKGPSAGTRAVLRGVHPSRCRTSPRVPLHAMT